jgi:hypothetical protein
MSVTCTNSGTPAACTRAANGHGSPKDNMSACGRWSRTQSTVDTSTAHARKPMPQGCDVFDVTTRSSRSSQLRSPRPAPAAVEGLGEAEVAVGLGVADAGVGAGLGGASPQQLVDQVWIVADAALVA